MASNSEDVGSSAQQYCSLSEEIVHSIMESNYNPPSQVPPATDYYQSLIIPANTKYGYLKRIVGGGEKSAASDLMRLSNEFYNPPIITPREKIGDLSVQKTELNRNYSQAVAQVIRNIATMGFGPWRTRGLEVKENRKNEEHLDGNKDLPTSALQQQPNRVFKTLFVIYFFLKIKIKR